MVNYFKALVAIVDELNATNTQVGSYSNRIEYQYDLTGNVKTAKHVYDGLASTLTYDYDEADNVTGITYSNNFKVNYAYDDYDRIVKVSGYVVSRLPKTRGLLCR